MSRLKGREVGAIEHAVFLLETRAEAIRGQEFNVSHGWRSNIARDEFTDHMLTVARLRAIVDGND